MEEVITLQFDGGSRGNPGPAGIGVVLRAEDGTPVVTLGRFIGRATNNVAEYKALITALEQAKKLGAKKIIVRGDSELIIKQMRGEYRVKNPDLKQLYDEAQHLLAHFDKSKIEHNYREDNTLADKLANLAMDRKAEVTDVDDPGPAPSVSASRPGASRPAPALTGSRSPGVANAGGSHATASAGTAGSAATKTEVGSVHTCPRCGCSVKILRPSGSPPENLGPFNCICGVRMKAE
ncbi:ribonuclease HI family protein [Humisphaera borealis]|uniref:Ribonuclease HI family protein n=1 Tax=Humisphaera borealis TaxID=2807512 RepID=A0A7M2X162_9BACT|nr:ribonuclease HI family protein [Humisphaera borealis]QOV90851.1 ribonuclease HI family protein [Humisphaera borealis]